ncbi:MAG TPA: ATP-binding protein [Gammaproteobacteria bacterium]|nr:ATP-binding protein [Gammaproteobacteria bacterium]
MNLRSIGVRLTIWYAAAFAVALLFLGAGMWFTVQQSLYHAVDESLSDRVEGIRRFIEDHKTRLSQDEVKEEFLAHGDLFQVIDADGRWVHQAETLNGAPATLAPPAESGVRFANVAFRGTPLRVISQNIDVDGRRYTVQVAAPLRELQQGLREGLWLLVPLFPLVLLIACAGGYWMSRRALAPVDQVTQTARSITAENLSKRLDVPRTGDELERLSQTLNEMIGRLESAFRKISRFTADASHELRTPLAVMRTTAEVALRGPQPDSEHSAALEQIIAEVERTSHLVENLLLIAKADSGEAQLHKRPVDLVQAVSEACSQASVLARVKGIKFEARLPEKAIWLTGDSHALRRLFLILLDNAVKYTPAGGTFEVSLAESDGLVVGAVRDTGIGISEEDLPHIFDRFYRVDRARSREQGGAGLGLAIGRWITEAHGGILSVESELDRGSLFRVQLPST